MAKEMKYSEAIAELEAVVREMESDDINVDDLSEKIKRSAYLIKFCKSKLNETEKDVDAILKEIESSDE